MTPEKVGSSGRTRASLIEAAAVAFSRHGYHGTTTAEIAAAAGCSEPTLFKYFGSKQALLIAALHETAARLIDRLDSADGNGAGGLEPAGSFEEFARRARSLLVDPRLGQLSRLRNFALALSDETDLGDGTTGLAIFLERVSEAVRAGQRSGSVRSDVPAADVAQVVFALSLLYGFRSALDGDEAAATGLSPVVDTLLTMLRSS